MVNFMSNYRDELKTLTEAFNKTKLGTLLFISANPQLFSYNYASRLHTDFIGVYIDSSLEASAFLDTKKEVKRKSLGNATFFEIGFFYQELLNGNINFLEILINEDRWVSLSGSEALSIASWMFNSGKLFLNANINAWVDTQLHKFLKVKVPHEHYRNICNILVKALYMNKYNKLPPPDFMTLIQHLELNDIIRNGLLSLESNETHAGRPANETDHDVAVQIINELYQVFSRDKRETKLNIIPRNSRNIMLQLMKFRNLVTWTG